MSLLTKDAELLVQYNKTWGKNYKEYQKINLTVNLYSMINI